VQGVEAAARRKEQRAVFAKFQPATHIDDQLIVVGRELSFAMNFYGELETFV